MLTQAEIDALLSSELGQEDEAEPSAEFAAPPAGGPARAGQTRRIRPYNFWSPERFSKNQMTAIGLVHEDLGQRLATSVPAYLLSEFRARLTHLEQGRFDDLAKGIPANTLYNILAFEPLPGRAVLIFSPEIAGVMLERLLGGGSRTPQSAARPLTDIGQALLRGTVEFMLNDLKAAWSKVVALEPRLEDATVNHLWVSMLMRNAPVVLVFFELSLHGVTGTMNIYIPFSMLKPIASALTPTAWMARQDETRASDEARQAIAQTLAEARLPVWVELGQAELTMGQLTTLAAGDVLRLNTAIRQELSMWIGGEVRYPVLPGTLGSRLAVRITGR